MAGTVRVGSMMAGTVRTGSMMAGTVRAGSMMAGTVGFSYVRLVLLSCHYKPSACGTVL